jgi:hypothetical protein
LTILKNAQISPTVFISAANITTGYAYGEREQKLNLAALFILQTFPLLGSLGGDLQLRGVFKN